MTHDQLRDVDRDQVSWTFPAETVDILQHRFGDIPIRRVQDSQLDRQLPLFPFGNQPPGTSWINVDRNGF